MIRWVGIYAGVPPVGAFGDTEGQGTPVILNTLTDVGYYLKAGVVTAFSGGGGGGGGGTVTSVTLTQPAAGLTVTNSGVSQTTVVTGVFALANDLAALEGLASTGFAKRTGTDAWSVAELSGDVTTSSFTATIANDAVTNAKLANMAANTIKARKTASTGDPEDCTLSEVLDFIGSAAQGDVLYRGASAWARLPAGTSGQVLQTQGTGANPQWATVGAAAITLNSQSANYTTVLGDGNNGVIHPSSDANDRTFSIAAESSVNYPLGTCITFINKSTNLLTITVITSGGDTLVLAGTILTGNVYTLNKNGVATAIKTVSKQWEIGGQGLG